MLSADMIAMISQDQRVAFDPVSIRVMRDVIGEGDPWRIVEEVHKINPDVAKTKLFDALGLQANYRQKNSTNSTNSTPEPLFREMSEASPYPFDALGSIGSGAAREIHRIIQAPDAICGQSILAGMSHAAQAHADIEVDGRRKPISCYFTSVGGTGERKSAVDAIATKPHSEFERQLAEQYSDEFSAYEREHAAWKAARDDGMKKAKGMQAKQQHLDEMGDPPVPPALPGVLIEEPTYEGLIKLLQDGQPSVGLFTDEGGRFVGGHAMNSENALKTAAGISSLWDSGCAKRTRAGDGHSIIYGKRLSMHLMLQGLVAEMLLSNEVFREQGLLSRLLVASPESTVGDRPYVAESPNDQPEVQKYHSHIKELLNKSLPMNERRELDPPVLSLSTNAKRIWVPYHNICDSEAKRGGRLESCQGLANKAPEHATRLAAVLAVIQGATVVDAETMDAGIELMNYYLNESIRMTDTGMIDPATRDASTLLKWLQEKGHHLIYPVMVYQSAPIRCLRTKKAAMAAIEILESHGWLHRVGKMEVDGTVRKDVWRLNES